MMSKTLRTPWPESRSTPSSVASKSALNTSTPSKRPKSALDFLKGLRAWTSTRGYFQGHPTAEKSLISCYSFLHRGKKSTKRGGKEVQRWTDLGIQTTWLQSKFNHCRSHGQGAVSYLNEFKQRISLITPAPLDDSEITNLYDLIANTYGNARYIQNRHNAKKTEKSTFPHERHGRHRLTPIRHVLGSNDKMKNGTRQPSLPVDRLCRDLGLPQLPGPPGQDTFCYYIGGSRCYKLLVQGTSAGKTLSPRMRAALLDVVEIF